MLYEGIPTGKKNKERPAHPAPKHEQVFGTDDTVKTLEEGLQRKEDAAIAKDAPAHDAVWGKADREKVFKDITDQKRDSYVEGMANAASRDRTAIEAVKARLRALFARHKRPTEAQTINEVDRAA